MVISACPLSNTLEKTTEIDVHDISDDVRNELITSGKILTILSSRIKDLKWSQT